MELIKKTIQKIRNFLHNWRLYQSFAAKLPYEAIAVHEGVPILFSNQNALTVFFRIYPDDFRFSLKRNAINEIFQNAVAKSETNCNGMVEYDIHRAVISRDYLTSVHFPNALTRLNDYEAKCHFTTNQFANVYTMAFTLFQDSLVSENRFYNLALKAAIPELSNNFSSLDFVAKFVELVHGIKGELSSSGHLKVELLDTSSKVLNYLESCITGNLTERFTDDHQFVPNLDTLLGNHYLYNGQQISRIDDTFTSVLSLVNFPLCSEYDRFDDILFSKHCCRFYQRYFLLEQKYATKALEYRLTLVRSSFIRLRDTLKEMASIANEEGFVGDSEIDSISDAEAALDASRSGKMFGYYEGKFITYSKTKEEAVETTKEFKRILDRTKFVFVPEGVNTTPAFCSSLPVNAGCSPHRRRLLPLENFAQLVNFSYVITGSKKCPSARFPKNSPALMQVTSKNTSIYLNLANENSGKEILHGTISGDTGKGKTAAAMHIGVNFLRYPKSNVFYIDKLGATKNLCSSMGDTACYYDILGKNGPSFAPFSELGSDFTWLSYWLQYINSLKKRDFQEAQIFIEAALSSLQNCHEPSFKNLICNIQHIGIRQNLRDFYESSQGILSGTSDSFNKTCRWHTYELEHVYSAPEKIRLPILLFLIKRTENYIRSVVYPAPSLLIWDESWTLINSSDEIILRIIEKFLRTFRKLNSGILFLTQNLIDFVNSPIFDLILGSCVNHIFCADSKATVESQAKIYRQFGLNDLEIETLSTLRERQDYLVIKPDLRAVIQFNLQSIFKALIDTTPENMRRIEQAKIEHGKDWLFHYLMKIGLRTQANKWKEFCNEKNT